MIGQACISMNVREIMTRDVVAVAPTASVLEAARLMADHGISGLPVVDDDGRVVGIVSEGDLILRQRPRPYGPWWRAFFADPERLARDYQKAHGVVVEEVMTRPAITIGPDLPIESAALILEQQRIRRLPVVEDGRLVGILSRGDLVKAMAAAPRRTAAPMSDDALVEEMQIRLAQEPWVSNRRVVVQAKDGVLTLWGAVATEAEKSALGTMARAIEGAKGVENHLLIMAESPTRYGV